MNFNETSNFSARTFGSTDIVFIILAILIVGFNGTLLSVMRKYKRLQNAQNGLLASLAVSDLSSGLVGIPLAFACTYLPEHLCVVCSVSYYFFKFISISTVLHILAIIGERCFLVVDPFLHRRLRASPRRSNSVIIATIWITSLLVSSIPWIWLAETNFDCFALEDVHNETWTSDSIYELSCFLLFFFIPLLLISIFLTKIFIAVHQFTRRKSQRCLGDSQEQVRLRKTEMRIFIVLSCVFLIFVVCWLPFFALTLVHFVNKEGPPGWVEDYFTYSRSITSIVNPFVYAFYKDDIYQTIKRKLHNARCWSKARNNQRFSTKTRQRMELPLVAVGNSASVRNKRTESLPI